MGIIKSIFGDEGSKFISKSQAIIKKVNDIEVKIETLTNLELKGKTQEFKDRIKNGELLEDILPEAFAVVRETAKRVLGQRHYDVQILGGLVLHSGLVAEMRTGEGKTLVATLPAYLNALTEKGVHVITVNDYLSRRDAVWMAPVFSMLGLSVGVLNSGNNSFIYDSEHKNSDEDISDNAFRVDYEFLKPCTRREAYACDITYGTNNEFGFDYLRDNLAQRADHISQRGHHYAIVDEVDSILIDESRTPLIISSQAGDSENLYYKFADISKQLKKKKIIL